ncbi:hypothetical protein [Halobacterium hubeiense]|uniref:hypothetical protein n=1 Tax=Halobacterium hubeiense TaxID=1407499 RepID=UPI0015C6722F|nr:hypothetical protein [Halobacterium hubeiense]
MESVDELGLMFRTGENRDSTVLNRDERLVRRMSCEATTGTAHTASRPVVKEVSGCLRRVPTNRGELLEMVVTADKWSCKLVKNQERQRMSFWRLECKLARFTLHRWKALVTI